MKARRATQYIGVTLYSPKVRDTITLNLQKVQITNGNDKSPGLSEIEQS
jgi:hypothetical protein